MSPMARAKSATTAPSSSSSSTTMAGRSRWAISTASLRSLVSHRSRSSSWAACRRIAAISGLRTASRTPRPTSLMTGSTIARAEPRSVETVDAPRSPIVVASAAAKTSPVYPIPVARSRARATASSVASSVRDGSWWKSATFAASAASATATTYSTVL